MKRLLIIIATIAMLQGLVAFIGNATEKASEDRAQRIDTIINQATGE